MPPVAEQRGRGNVVAESRRGRKPIADPLHLTPSERTLLVLVDSQGSDRDGFTASKRSLSEQLGRNVKTVDRAAAHLRRLGMLESVACFDAVGGQCPSAYRVTMLARRTYPELFGGE